MDIEKSENNFKVNLYIPLKWFVIISVIILEGMTSSVAFATN